MQNLKKYIVALTCAILFGLTVVTLFPPMAKADSPGPCAPAQPECNSWLECTTQTGCAPNHYMYIWAGSDPNCKKCWVWHGCVETCPPA